MCRVLFQSKGHIFNKLIEQKQNLKDPAKIDASISQAIDLAFENKELTNLSAELNHSMHNN